MDAPRPCQTEEFADYLHTQHKFQKPHRLYTGLAAKVARIALGAFTIGYAGRAVFLAYSGVSVLTPALAVSVALSTICCVAFCYLRARVNAVAKERQDALDYIKENPNMGVKGHLRFRPGLSYAEVATLIADKTAETLTFQAFCDLNGVEALAYIKEESLKKLFESFLNSLEELYIKPGFSQYEAALRYFMKPHLQREFQARWDQKLESIRSSAKDKFLQSLSHPGEWRINRGGPQNTIREPCQRLGVTYEELVKAEFDIYNLSGFVKLHGSQGFKFLPSDTDFVGKLAAFVDIVRKKSSDITEAYFKTYIDDICEVHPHLRSNLEACVQQELSQLPSPSPAASVEIASAPSDAASAAAERLEQLEAVKRYPYRHEGILGHLKHSPRLTYDEVAKLLANCEARTQPFIKFCARNGEQAVGYVDERLQRTLFNSFLESLLEIYISRDFSQYAAAFSRFSAPLQEECKRRLEELRVETKRKFLEALGNPDCKIDFGGVLAAMEGPGRRLGVTHEEVAKASVHQEFCRYHLGEFMWRNGPDALKYLQVSSDLIVAKLEEFVGIEWIRKPNLTAGNFSSYIGYLCGSDSDLRRRLEECVHNALLLAPPTRSTSASTAAAAAAAAASAASSSSSDEGVDNSRRTSLAHFKQYPYRYKGIKDMLSQCFGILTYDELAELFANHEARTQPFIKFCARNGVRAIDHITDERCLMGLFDSFLESLPEIYIRPGFSQYEAALPHFLSTQHFGPEFKKVFQSRWEEKLGLVRAQAKDRFLEALRNPETFQIFGGALAAVRDPGERLGVTHEEVVEAIVDQELRHYHLREFLERNLIIPLRYCSKGFDIVGKLKEIVEIERIRDPDLTAEDFDPHIDYLCGVDISLRGALEECVQNEFSQSPMPSSTPASSAAAAAAAARP
jgi:hypothetical protein